MQRAFDPPTQLTVKQAAGIAVSVAAGLGNFAAAVSCSTAASTSTASTGLTAQTELGSRQTSNTMRLLC
jgi:hypothetical protein